MLSDILNRWFAIRFVIVAAVLALFVLLIGWVVYAFALVNIAADGRDSKWFYTLVHGYFKTVVEARADDVEAPDDLDAPGRVALGAQHYAQNCVRCHGGPGLGQNPMGCR